VPFQAAAEQLAALATGELHLGVGGPEPGLFNAAARGVDLRIVGHNSLVTPTDASAALIVRRDLLDSGRVAEPKDLKGLTIAMNIEKSTSQLYVERILAKGGLQLDDAELKLVPFTEMPVALGNRAVDAARAVEGRLLHYPIRPELVGDTAPVPLHAGAARYYCEQGLLPTATQSCAPARARRRAPPGLPLNGQQEHARGRGGAPVVLALQNPAATPTGRPCASRQPLAPSRARVG
jgi:hypothetical protein